MIERIEVNLLPGEYRVHGRKFRLDREYIYSTAGLVLVTLVLIFLTVMKRQEAAQLKRDISVIVHKIQENDPIKAEITSLRKDRTTIQEKIRALERISVNQEKWVRLMEIFANSLPGSTWLTSVDDKGEKGNTLELKGKTHSFPEVAYFMSKLTMTDYIASVDLSNIEEVDDEDRAFLFSLVCTLNPDIGIKKATSVYAAKE